MVKTLKSQLRLSSSFSALALVALAFQNCGTTMPEVDPTQADLPSSGEEATKTPEASDPLAQAKMYPPPAEATHDQYIAGTWLFAFGYQVDATSYQAWLQNLNGGSQTRAQFVQAVYSHDVFINRALTNREFVVKIHRGMLKRNPTSSEADRMTQLLFQGWPRIEAVKLILASAEFTKLAMENKL